MNFNPFARCRAAAALACCALWLGAAPAQAAPFTVHSDGTVTDGATDLMWDQCSRGQTWSSGPACTGTADAFTWVDALNEANVANDASHRGHNDWRLPNVKELESLLKLDAHSPAIDVAAFPNTPPSSFFWSSTVYTPHTANAWAVHFGDGSAYALNRGNTVQVRLVRGGQSFDPFYRVGGSLNGLAAGASVVLRNNGGDDLTLSANGSFSFATEVLSGNAYAVTVHTQPANPPQTCTVSKGNGTVGTSDVSDVQVQCVTHSYAVTGNANPAAGGSVSCSPNPVTHGEGATCAVSTNAGYVLGGVSSNTCGVSLSGNTFTTGPVTADCTVTARFLNTQTSFSGTTVPPAGGTPGPASASFTGGGAACRFDTTGGATAFIAAPATPPAGQTLPQGMFQFKLIGCDATPVSMNITWPQAVSGYTKYGKVSAGAADSYFAPDNLSVSGNTVSFTVQDGQKGDDDWSVNGEIVDPSGPMAAAAVGAVTAVPTLGEWSLMLLGLLAAGLGMRRLRRV